MDQPSSKSVSDALKSIEAAERNEDHARTIARQRVHEWRSNAARDGLPLVNTHDSRGAKVLDIDSVLKWEPEHLGRK